MDMPSMLVRSGGRINLHETPPLPFSPNEEEELNFDYYSNSVYPRGQNLDLAEDFADQVEGESKELPCCTTAEKTNRLCLCIIL